jgi:hypothetical protein
LRRHSLCRRTNEIIVFIFFPPPAECRRTAGRDPLKNKRQRRRVKFFVKNFKKQNFSKKRLWRRQRQIQKFQHQTDADKCFFFQKKERGIATAARPKNSENSDKNRAQNLIP